jgi:hypothetical protein
VLQQLSSRQADLIEKRQALSLACCAAKDLQLAVRSLTIIPHGVTPTATSASRYFGWAYAMIEDMASEAAQLKDRPEDMTPEQQTQHLDRYRRLLTSAAESIREASEAWNSIFGTDQGPRDNLPYLESKGWKPVLNERFWTEILQSDPERASEILSEKALRQAEHAFHNWSVRFGDVRIRWEFLNEHVRPRLIEAGGDWIDHSFSTDIESIIQQINLGDFSPPPGMWHSPEVKRLADAAQQAQEDPSGKSYLLTPAEHEMLQDIVTSSKRVWDLVIDINTLAYRVVFELCPPPDGRRE